MALTLRQMNYFLALVETGSFGQAAARVHVTQPALSQQIKEMESNLGAKLVERLPRGMRLTRAGQVVLERARPIMADVHAMENAVRLQSGLAGRLMLGVIPTIAPYLLPQALARIRARDINLELRVKEAQTSILLTAVADGTLDAAIVSPPLDQAGLAVEHLFEDRFLLAGTRTRLAALAGTGRMPSPKNVPSEQLLLLEEGHCLADQALDACGLTRNPKVDLGASSLRTLAGLVSEGFGVTLLPELSLRSEAEARGLTLVRFSDPEPRRDIILVRRTTTDDDGWFSQLAAILRDAGSELTEYARRQF